MNLIFVYGTLKRGERNHHFMTGQTFVAEARTLPGFRLYDLGDYPGMVADATATQGIEGEIWAVDAAGLSNLDELEGLAEGLYRRELVALPPPFSAMPVQTYLLSTEKSKNEHDE